MRIVKIVITGGPCAGKSTAMTSIKDTFSDKGYQVLFVPETATELITGGVAPWTCGTNADFQKCQMTLQMEKEKLFKKAGLTMPCENLLIVCDRGTIDNKVYMSDDEYNEVLDYLHLNEKDLLNDYDAVFHLVTAAKGAEKYYTTENNAARIETAKEAAVLDDKLLKAWENHSYLRVIDNSTGIEEKIERLIHEISLFLKKI